MNIIKSLLTGNFSNRENLAEEPEEEIILTENQERILKEKIKYSCRNCKFFEDFDIYESFCRKFDFVSFGRDTRRKKCDFHDFDIKSEYRNIQDLEETEEREKSCKNIGLISWEK